MKLSPVAISLAILGSVYCEEPTVSCDGNSAVWSSPVEARDFVDFACKGQNGMFTGWFDPLQDKAMCPRSSKDPGERFEVQNLNDHEGFDLGDDDCYKQLRLIIDNCRKGGQMTVAGWLFKAYPGVC